MSNAIFICIFLAKKCCLDLDIKAICKWSKALQVDKTNQLVSLYIFILSKEFQKLDVWWDKRQK